jgi:hypothetical protein
MAPTNDMLDDPSEPAALTEDPRLASLAGSLARDGHVLLRAAGMAELLGQAKLAEWQEFAASWEDLGPDTYMADGGRYRKRRFSAFSLAQGRIRRKPSQPHYQSRDFNRLNGGVERWFEPVTEAVAAHPVTTAILLTCDRLFTGLTTPALRPEHWHVEMHQFRVEARPGEEGKPTPEGMHQDGVDWVLVMLVRRENIASGETRIADLRREPLGAFILTDPLDASFVDDTRVFHGVTPIRPLHPGKPAFRDVLVVTFRRA